MASYKYNRTKRGIKKMQAGGSKGGKIGGSVSPANLKNDPDRARELAAKSVEARRAKKLAAENTEV